MTNPNERLDPATHMDTLSLRVFDLATMVEYYTHGVGLVLLSEGGGTLTLGLGDRPVLKLVHAPELRRPPSSAAGLYHSAVLFDSRADLSASLLSIFTSHPHTYTGSADHLVSEAFYFTDPEGNGVELYHDRPRDQWTWIDGKVQMDTLYVDPNEFVNRHLAGVDLATMAPTEATLGHVHLQVGDLESARDFYVNGLGFDETFAMPGNALFVSAGGYHHHMAMNVWNSAGAGPRQNTLGMGVVDILVPQSDELGRAEERLRHKGFRPTFDGRTMSVLDPWNNEIRLSVG